MKKYSLSFYRFSGYYIVIKLGTHNRNKMVNRSSVMVIPQFLLKSSETENVPRFSKNTYNLSN